ncbi:MAG: GAF domain-containing protein [Ktedonobacterales bacterium]
MAEHYVTEHIAPERSERLLGTQEAAKLLGLHRSTLNMAVRRRLLIPDEQTPGGHLRFHPATLETFRERLVVCPATGAETAAAPMRLLTDLLCLLAHEGPLEALCGRVIDIVPRALPGIAICLIARAVVEPDGRLMPQTIAASQLPEEVITRFEQIKTTFKFATIIAMRTLSTQYCEDVFTEQIHTGTRELLRIWPLGCYAVVPVALHGQTVGVLVCTGPAPRHFTDHDKALLGAVADALAVAFRRQLEAQHEEPRLA